MKVGLVGCGSIGLRHLGNLNALGVQVIAYDPEPPARERALEAGAKGITTSLEELADWSLDGAVIACSTAHHVDGARPFLDQATPTFIEKPLSHSRAGLNELIGLAHGVPTMVGCNMRFHPGPATVKKLLDEGAIGNPLHARIHTGSFLPEWRPTQDFRTSYSASVSQGGAILDCIHELDLAQWLLGPGRLLHAQIQPAKSLGLETDGLAEFLIDHGGVLASVHLNFVRRDYARGLCIIGPDGTIDWDHRRGTVELRLPDETNEISVDSDANDAMYLEEMRAFLDMVAGGPAHNPVSEAAATLELALQGRGTS